MTRMFITKRLYFIIIIIVIMASNVSWSDEMTQDENVNFVLHVSNQSFAIDPVDIKIYIDGKVVVNQDFYVGTQHTYVSYRFLLSKGQHDIKIESEKGDAIFEEGFEIIDKHSGIICYWYYPDTHYAPSLKHFTFDFGRDEPVLIN